MTKEQRDDAFYLALDGYAPSAIAKRIGLELTPEIDAIYWDAQDKETRWVINNIWRLNNVKA